MAEIVFLGHSGDPSRDALLIGERLASRYARWADGDFDLVTVARSLAGRTGGECPLGRAAVAIAAVAAKWGGHPYHSALHHGEVACNAMTLAAAAGIRGRDRRLLLCAALGHDIGFEPGAPRVPFRLEAAAAAEADIAMAACGVARRDRAAVTALILATEPSARTALRALAGGGRSPALPAELLDLGADAGLAALAAVLSDADLMSSVALTPAWSEVQCARLSEETGRRIDAPAFLGFLDGVAGPTLVSRAGGLVNPNLDRVRLWAREQAATHASSARP